MQENSIFFFFFLVIPQFGLLSDVSSLRLSSGHSGLVLTLSMQTVLPCPAPTHLWQTWASVLLLYWQLCLGVYSVGFFFFFLPVTLPSEIPKLPTDPPVRGFSTVSKLLLQNSLPGQVSIPNSFAFLSFIFCPTSFQRECVVFLGAWCPPPVFRSCFVDVAQHLNDLLMNLWGRKWSPCPIPPSWDRPSTAFF